MSCGLFDVADAHLDSVVFTIAGTQVHLDIGVSPFWSHGLKVIMVIGDFAILQGFRYLGLLRKVEVWF